MQLQSLPRTLAVRLSLFAFSCLKSRARSEQSSRRLWSLGETRAPPSDRATPMAQMPLSHRAAQPGSPCSFHDLSEFQVIVQFGICLWHVELDVTDSVLCVPTEDPALICVVFSQPCSHFCSFSYICLFFPPSFFFFFWFLPPLSLLSFSLSFPQHLYFENKYIKFPK